MTLDEFLLLTHGQVRSETSDPSSSHPYEESVFSEIVMQHMADVGMTYEPRVCHYSAKIGNANLRLSGYAVSEDGDQLDLFVSIYSGADSLTSIPDSETKNAADQCLRFLNKCAEGRLAATMDESNDAYVLALTIQETFQQIDEIRVFVLTDRVAKAKNFKPRDISGKTVKLEVMDIERLHRHWAEGKPRDELVVNFEEIGGAPLPCIYVPGETTDYDYALTAIPGEVLRHIYEKFGARLLEANVRSFLSATGKVNKGIRDTLRRDPEKFMAYNNGIVLVADEAQLGRCADKIPGISWLKGMQIVNGGQTTASLYFTKKKYPEVDLGKVRIPAKVIILHVVNSTEEEALISDISRYANSQNSVKQSDLSANKPFHVELEKLAMSVFCPDGNSRWFYERAAGSYNTMLAREGTTLAKLKQLKSTIPTSRKITKTDLAKFLCSFDQKPDQVSLGSQKNFEKFMESLRTNSENENEVRLPSVAEFKRIIAKAIIYKGAQKLIRPKFPAFQANITTYVVSLLASRVGDRLDLEQIWGAQDISQELQKLILEWAGEVNGVLHASANGRMVSEWAKKPDCWEIVRSANYSSGLCDDVPELRPI
ncbi:MAG: AIPR family protein [Alphaproteobacteria bacterium]|nr:AIPR family protein [Alphaproteobacteria bacterium]